MHALILFYLAANHNGLEMPTKLSRALVYSITHTDLTKPSTLRVSRFYTCLRHTKALGV